eukprot:c11692_g1_i2.p1 GENE.c11692_g1_i2~~c11692_g1_i2.p1  ORF type:complete len:336 (-),score=92.40 c11692_g1_i2:185-1192(-)
MTCNFVVGWCAWGINDHQRMQGADVFWVTANTTTVQVADAYAAVFYTNPYVDTVQSLNNVVTSTADSRTTVRFSRSLVTGDTQDTPIRTDGTTQYLIYASNQGNVARSFSQLTGHQHAGSAARGYFSVVFRDSTVVALQVTKNMKWTVHGWLMFLSWGVVVPLGVFLARYLQSAFPNWIAVHRNVQLVGVAAGIAGIALGLAMTNKNVPLPHLKTHKALGIAVLVLGALSAIVGFIRPLKSKLGVAPSTTRRTWFVMHFTIGIASVGIALYNMWVGVYLYHLNHGLTIALIVWYVVLGACVIAGEISNCCIRRSNKQAIKAASPHAKFESDDPSL